MTAFPNLLNRGTMGRLEVKNRVFMAPLTRNRAQANGIPKPMAATYYAQRASAGLIVTEATQIDPVGKGYLDTPGIHTDDQAAAWAQVVEAVHQLGGLMVMQLWHVGRISHLSLLPPGTSPVAPSAIPANTQTFTEKGFEPVSPPRALTLAEVEAMVGKYAAAAKLAIQTGMDGVEIHGANGYLINQFIATNTNQRTDQYGGTVENRARLLLQVIDAVAEAIGGDCVGVRLSPTGKFNDIDDQAVRENYTYLYDQIGDRNLAYLHVVERFPGIPSSAEDEALIQDLRQRFRGNYIANGGYDPFTAEAVIADGAFAVAFGRPFIANPDLPERIARDMDLAEPDGSTFYGGDEKGYIDYPRAT
jgi:N-ethylmaleimide reductase